MSAWIIKRFPGAKKQQSTTSCTKTTELEVVFWGARGNQQHASIQVTGMCDFLWSAPPKGPRGRWLFGNGGRALPSRTRHLSPMESKASPTFRQVRRVSCWAVLSSPSWVWLLSLTSHQTWKNLAVPVEGFGWDTQQLSFNNCLVCC